MSTDGPSASQAEGVLARWLAASVRTLEKGMDLVSNYLDSVENTPASALASPGTDRVPGSPSREDGLRRVALPPTHDEQDRRGTPSSDRSSPAPGPSTATDIHSSPFPAPKHAPNGAASHGLAAPAEIIPSPRRRRSPSDSPFEDHLGTPESHASSSKRPRAAPTRVPTVRDFGTPGTPVGAPTGNMTYYRSMAPPPSPHQPPPPVKTPRPPTRSSTLRDPPPPPSLTDAATASSSSTVSSSARTSVPSSRVPSATSFYASTSQSDLDEALAMHGVRRPRPVRKKMTRKHIFDDVHKAKVSEIRKMDREEMEKALFEDARRRGFSSDFLSFHSKLSYQELLEGRGVLSPSQSLGDLRDAARLDEHRRYSFGDDPSRDFLERAFEKARATLSSPRPPPQWTPSLEQLQISRRRLDEAIDQRIRPKLPKTLPPEDEVDVDTQLARRGTIARVGREQVTDRDMARLRPHEWLNDEIINFYGALILERAQAETQNRGGKAEGVNGVPSRGKKPVALDVHYYSTFFWEKLTREGYEKARLNKWTKKLDIFQKDMLLIPVNHSNTHWTGAAINFRRKRIESYDSMGMKNKIVFQTLRNYLDDEHKNKKKVPFDFTDWVDYTLPDTPQQENGYDCGVFTCQFLEYLSRGEETFNFSQKDIRYLRRRMVWEIAHAQLRTDP